MEQNKLNDDQLYGAIMRNKLQEEVHMHTLTQIQLEKALREKEELEKEIEELTALPSE